MKWIEIKIKTKSEFVDFVSDILYEVGVTGVIIEDPKDIILTNKNKYDWDYYDESILNFHYDGAIVKGYLPEGDDISTKLDKIYRNINNLEGHNTKVGELGEVETKEVFEEDWANSWKKYYKPQKIGDIIVVKPSWENYDAKEQEKIIELDPGMAFGTGTHETTSMCIKVLEKYIKTQDTVFDIGCGSGILSITAALLGASRVIGVDLDEVAVNVSSENVRLNKVEDIVTIKHGNLMDTIHEKANIIVANIIAEVIVMLAKDIKDFLKDDGIFIASGIIVNKIDEVIRVLNSNGFRVKEVIREGEWISIISELYKDGIDE